MWAYGMWWIVESQITIHSMLLHHCLLILPTNTPGLLWGEEVPCVIKDDNLSFLCSLHFCNFSCLCSWLVLHRPRYQTGSLFVFHMLHKIMTVVSLPQDWCLHPCSLFVVLERKTPSIMAPQSSRGNFPMVV